MIWTNVAQYYWYQCYILWTNNNSRCVTQPDNTTSIMQAKHAGQICNTFLYNIRSYILLGLFINLIEATKKHIPYISRRFNFRIISHHNIEYMVYFTYVGNNYKLLLGMVHL